MNERKGYEFQDYLKERNENIMFNDYEKQWLRFYEIELNANLISMRKNKMIYLSHEELCKLSTLFANRCMKEFDKRFNDSTKTESKVISVGELGRDV